MALGEGAWLLRYILKYIFLLTIHIFADIFSSMNTQGLGLNIAKLRRKAGLTQVELAERAGTTQAVISRIESGRGNPRFELLERIATATGRPLRLTLGADTVISRQERRTRVRQALGDFEFNPWERSPTVNEMRSLVSDGLVRESFASG
jgi:transcriptional regulator with XRE-family HTH domain